MKREYSTPCTVNSYTSLHWSFHTLNQLNSNHSGPGYRISLFSQPKWATNLRSGITCYPIIFLTCCRQRLFSLCLLQSLMFYQEVALIFPTSFHTLHSRWSNLVQFPQTFAVTIPSSNLAYSIKLSSNIIGILPKDDPTSHPARIPIISVEPQQSAIDPLLFIVQLSGNNLNTENNTHLCLPTWLLPRQLDVFVQHPCIGWVTVSCSLMQRKWSHSSQFLPTKAHSTQYDQLSGGSGLFSWRLWRAKLNHKLSSFSGSGKAERVGHLASFHPVWF